MGAKSEDSDSRSPSPTNQSLGQSQKGSERPILKSMIKTKSMASVDLPKIQSPQLKNKQQTMSFCDHLTKK